MREYDNVIFDLDGTLLNTEAGIVKSLTDMSAELGFHQIPPGDCRRFIGPPIEQSVLEYFKLDESQAAEASAVFRKFYTERYLFEAEPYDGIRSALGELKASGIKLAIATYKRHDYATRVIKHFELDKDCAPCLGSDPATRITKLSTILACMEEMNASVKRTVYIGDTEHDKISAKQAGISFIGVTYGFGYKNASPGFAETPTQLVELILGGK